MQSRSYSIPRTVLSRLTGLYYLRTFWPILIPPFLCGAWLLIFGMNKEMRVLGLIAAGWPATVFARTLLLTRNAAQAWAKPTVLSFDEDALYFESQCEPVSRLRLRRSAVRRLVRLSGFYLVQFRRFEFVPIPEGVFASDEDRARFEELLTTPAPNPAAE